MRPAGRLLALLAPMALLAACQQAVRPQAVEPAMPSVPTVAAPVADPPVASTLADVPPPAATAPALTPATRSGEEVFARIRSRLGPGICTSGDNSARWKKRYSSNAFALQRQLRTALPLLDFVSAEIEREGLPPEFVFIPLIESGYRPGAIGSGGPAGMWQMISSTARNHGIHIKAGYDGRLSPVESTRAALAYLDTLHDTFGGWEATVMAYNAGEGRMRRAFARAGSRSVSASQRKPAGLSDITYNYVGRLKALSCIVARPADHGMQLPTSATFTPLVAVQLARDVRSLDELAARSGLEASGLRLLNPAFKGGRLASGVPRWALLPAPAALQVAGVPSTSLATATPGNDDASPVSTHQVSPGESLWSIARRYSLSIEALRQANKLGRSSIVHPGQLLKLAP